ncbi:hypothetical protein [Aureispira sp. CCB-E]|nr:hypothetical protein [Aureispira sp. CCB-E]WMX17093.1 hypothetical protein QP953_11985 [Aureispira sp. CCB-E]
MKRQKTVFIYRHKRLLRRISVCHYARIDQRYRLDLEPNCTHLRIKW